MSIWIALGTVTAQSWCLSQWHPMTALGRPEESILTGPLLRKAGRKLSSPVQGKTNRYSLGRCALQRGVTHCNSTFQ